MIMWLFVIYTTCQGGRSFCTLDPVRLYPTEKACHAAQLSQPYVSTCKPVEVENGQ